VRFYSRGGYDWTKRLAGLAEALVGIARQSSVIDTDARGCGQQAAIGALPLRRVPGLAQGQDAGLASCEPGEVAAL
jgi:hypothetical protein